MISGFWASFCCTGSAPKIGIDTCRERMSFFYKKNILTLSGSLGSRECEGHAERLIMDAEFLRPRCQFSKKRLIFFAKLNVQIFTRSLTISFTCGAVGSTSSH